MTTRNYRWPAIIIANLFIINLTLYFFINLNYPLVGHDFSGTIPQMLDTVLHFRNNGLSIQWFTPSFGGGIPTFPNPNNGQFSILQFISVLVTPWRAVFISSVIYICVGFLACYRFFQRILNFSSRASILGAVFFSANGFIFQRIAVGHLGYQPFPILAVIILLLFDSALGSTLAGALLGLIVALLLHQSGYFLIVVFCLSALITLPVIYLTNPAAFSWKRILGILSTGAVVGLLISASKLSAVYSFMRFFPRLTADVYEVNSVGSFLGILMQLLGTMNLVPLFSIAGLNTSRLPDFLIFATGAEYGYWEFDLSLTPLVFGLILAGLLRILHAPRTFFKNHLRGYGWIALIFFIFFSWLVVEFTLAAGFFYPILRNLPILSSMHVNPRFASAFILPLAVLATLSFQSLTREIPSPRRTQLFWLANLLALVPLSTYFMIKADLQGRIYNITPSDHIYQSIRSGLPFEVIGIAENLDNTQALLMSMSNLNLYDPIFGYKLENFHPQIKAGSIWEISRGYYNMTDPTGYVYPETNNSLPFDRFKEQDRDKLATFAAHHQPKWELPLYQRVTNWISILSLIILLATICVQVTFGILKKSMIRKK